MLPSSRNCLTATGIMTLDRLLTSASSRTCLMAKVDLVRGKQLPGGGRAGIVGRLVIVMDDAY